MPSFQPECSIRIPPLSQQTIRHQLMGHSRCAMYRGIHCYGERKASIALKREAGQSSNKSCLLLPQHVIGL
ncbi:unnamed protein product [Urochloa humidicola]